MGNMKVHQLARGFWEHEPSLSLGCKRLRPLAPKLTTTTTTTVVTTTSPETATSFDLKSFIRPDSGSRKLCFSDNEQQKKEIPNQVETHLGGTRWNPTQEQIGILEMLYKGGMRTPNAQQIEHITVQLGKYGKIEGKNVFYWFQNHKARERQKQKRHNLGLSHSPRTNTTLISLDTSRDDVFAREEEYSPYKRKCMSIWGFEYLHLEENKTCKEEKNKTLELFPLHPEGK